MSPLNEAAFGGELSWDPEHRFNALLAQDALDDLPMAPAPAAAAKPVPPGA